MNGAQTEYLEQTLDSIFRVKL